MIDVLRGKVICLEGGEAAGKSTLLEGLVRALRPLLLRAGSDLIATREPGGTWLGQEIRKLILHRKDLSLQPDDEALLFAVDRALHYRDVVKPAVMAGKTVILDRSFVSSFVYQSALGGVDFERLIALTEQAIQATPIDLCIVLDVPPAIALARRDRALNTKDELPLSWHEQVRRGYELIVPPPGREDERPGSVRPLPGSLVRRVAWVDAAQPPERVLEQALQAISAAFGVPLLAHSA